MTEDIKTKKFRKRSMATALAVTAVLALTMSACGNDDSEDSMGGSSTTTAQMGSSPMSLTPTGAACSQVPTTGEGSVEGMANDPVATAASNNPLLTTLVTAVKQAGLVDTLNGTGPFTVFAPVNSAFEKIPAADLQALLADKTKLTDVLTYHVVAQRLTASDLANGKEVTTVEGKTFKVSGSGTSMKINDANVICANVPVGNGVVHLIDAVLMPS
jgi:uncharacterized surface protein with fasciclin (FAS1) repeats